MYIGERNKLLVTARPSGNADLFGLRLFYFEYTVSQIHCARFFTEIGKLNFDSFCRVAMHFLDDEDNEVMQKELKEAFRLYDKDGECA